MLKAGEVEDGYIKIKRVSIDKDSYMMHIINNIEHFLTGNETDIYISNLLSYDMVTPKEAKLLKVATSDNVLNLPKEYKDIIRARIFKNMLLNLID